MAGKVGGGRREPEKSSKSVLVAKLGLLGFGELVPGFGWAGCILGQVGFEGRFSFRSQTRQ